MGGRPSHDGPSVTEVADHGRAFLSLARRWPAEPLHTLGLITRATAMAKGGGVRETTIIASILDHLFLFLACFRQALNVIAACLRQQRSISRCYRAASPCQVAKAMVQRNAGEVERPPSPWDVRLISGLHCQPCQRQVILPSPLPSIILLVWC